MKLSKRVTGAACALGISLLAAVGAQADPVATYSPADDSSNITLSGLTLSSSSAVVFDYMTPNLSAFGDLAATLSLSATETGAVAFGPLSLGTFDGSFNFGYSGPTRTVGGITVHTGDSLLSGTFLGSVFTGYGSSAGITDSVLGGGLVSYNDSGFLTFDPASDQGLVLDLTGVDPSVLVVGGVLTDFTAASGGEFDATILSEIKGSVPEPATWMMLLTGFFGLGATLRRRRAKPTRQAWRWNPAARTSAALVALSLGVLASAGANATTFASYRASSVAPNMTLSGLTLSSSAPVLFKYVPPSLSAFGSLAATFSLSATETGAVAFGPLALGTFDGSFNFTYSGPTRTVGTLTVTTGQSLLSGTFLGSVFTGYGSSASLTDSVLGGGLVSYNNNPFLTFDPTGDQSITLGLTSIKPVVHVVGGVLTDFTSVSTGQFAAAGFSTSTLSSVHSFSVFSTPTPEPATWALMLTGFGLAGLALRRRRPAVAA